MPNSHAESDTAHPLAGLSATHRDLLWLLSQTGPSELPPLRQALADYYTDGIDRTHYCDTLEALRERDLIAKQTHDTTTYRLTESARRALSARQARQADNLSTTEREDE